MLELNQIQETLLTADRWLWLIPAFPLLGALVNGLLTLAAARGILRLPPALHPVLACLAAFASFLASWGAFARFRASAEPLQLAQELFSWIESGPLKASFALQLDALSVSLVVFITFTAFLIHVYSAGYMKGDPGYGRYFTYLNLFLASMLILVMAKNLLLLFLGWEGVGFCSYLLIGFWYQDEAKAEAGKKAIIVNRIGDAGFLAGLLAVYTLAGTFDLGELASGKGAFTEATATLVCLLFFFGAVGKSAQIPLHVWLPDAMAGPTPVSALIHAATMVTAGVYLVARLHFLYASAPWAALVVSVVGVVTALFAASIALAQNDIKKVLAYSTISQLGFMFLAVGVGAYGIGIFHLITHGFFKACLFLAAGSVIHALHGEQDIRKMGGLLKPIPLTCVSFVLGWLAIIGFPGFSGFFSKDGILWHVLATPNPKVPYLPHLLYFTALFTSFLTAFYMTRLTLRVFFGEYRGDAEVLEKAHESPRVMTFPLLALGIGSLCVGWIGVPEAIGGGDSLGRFLEPLFSLSTPVADALSHSMEPIFMLLAILVSGLGLLLAWYVYGLKHVVSAKLLQLIPGGKKALEGKYFVDELYEVTIVRWVKGFAQVVSDRLVERLLVEGLVDKGVTALYAVARWMKGAQMGLVRAYLGYIAIGAGLLIYWMLK